MITLKPLKRVGLVALCLAGLTPSDRALASPCAQTFDFVMPAEFNWRSATTQPSQKGEIFQTSPERESHLQNIVKSMEYYIFEYRGDYGQGDIPWMRFVAAKQSQATVITESYGARGIITRYAVSGVGKAAAIQGTLMLPVSGHQGRANALRWAVSDIYDIRIDTNPLRIPSTHSSWGGTRNETDLISGAKSLGNVTAQEIEIPLIKDVPVVVLYDRRGSAGPSGYVEGRVMEFIWDGT